MNQNEYKRMNGLMQKLLDLLDEGGEIFMEEHPGSLQSWIRGYQIFHPGAVYPFRSEEVLKRLRKQNGRETNKVIDALEAEFDAWDKKHPMLQGDLPLAI